MRESSDAITFQTQGFEGPNDLPPIHKSHPRATPPKTVERIRALAHSARGCNRFAAMLAPEGIRVSAPPHGRPSRRR